MKPKTNSQQTYPEFIFKSSSWQVKPPDIVFTFIYQIPPDIHFTHQITIPYQIKPEDSDLSLLAFNLGMVEIFNYWKTTAALNIVIKAGYLSSPQLSFWMNLLKQGMGEYFFTNHLNPNPAIKWQSNHPKTANTFISSVPENPNPLVMVGGGKDSAAVLGVLHENQLKFDTLSVNPTKASRQISRIAKPSRQIFINRTLDPQIQILNQEGFLNGHIPFSAVMAFIGLSAAYLNGQKYIITANEWSANEANTIYKGEPINHQYSKTLDFETRFRDYVTDYISPHYNYFSLIRPLQEIQIARLFAKYPEYHPKFLSCNRGAKDNLWCGQCSKCLFTYLILAGFISPGNMTAIFPTDLLQEKNLSKIAISLIDQNQVKPLDCVGTREEIKAAVYLAGLQYQEKPYLLKIMAKYLGDSNWNQKSNKLLKMWRTPNYLPKKYETALKKSLV